MLDKEVTTRLAMYGVAQRPAKLGRRQTSPGVFSSFSGAPPRRLGCQIFSALVSARVEFFFLTHGARAFMSATNRAETNRADSSSDTVIDEVVAAIEASDDEALARYARILTAQTVSDGTPDAPGPFLLAVMPKLVEVVSGPSGSGPVGDGVIELLHAVVNVLSFAQIRHFIPNAAIVEGAAAHAPIVNLVVSVLVHNVDDPDAAEVFHAVVGTLVQRYFSDPSLDIAIVTDTERLIAAVATSSRGDILTSEKLCRLYGPHIDPILAARTLDYVLLLVPQLNKDVPSHWPPIFELDPKTISDDADDPLYGILVVQFYARVIEAVPSDNVFQLLIPAIHTLTKAYLADATFAIDVVDMFVALSNSRPQFFASIVESHQLVATLSLGSQKDESFLARVDLRSLSESTQKECFQNLGTSSLVGARHFGVLLNFVRSSTLFELVSPFITSTSLASLTQDLVYPLLHTMSKYSHAVQYLLHELPSAVDKYLLGNHQIRDHDIWTLKREILDNLILHGHLLVFEEDIRREHSLMVNGPRMGGGRVDVASQAA